MARPAKPFPHQGWFKTNMGGGPRRKLCRIEEGIKKARDILRNLEGERESNGGSLPPELTVAEAAALFLREVETDKGPNHPDVHLVQAQPPASDRSPRQPQAQEPDQTRRNRVQAVAEGGSPHEAHRTQARTEGR